MLRPYWKSAIQRVLNRHFIAFIPEFCYFNHLTSFYNKRHYSLFDSMFCMTIIPLSPPLKKGET